MNARIMRNEQSKKLVAFFGTEEALCDWAFNEKNMYHVGRKTEDYKETADKFLQQFPEIHAEFVEYYKNDNNIDLSNVGHLNRVLSFYDDNGVF